MSNITYFNSKDFKEKFIEKIIKEDIGLLSKLYNAGCLSIVSTLPDSDILPVIHREWYAGNDSVILNNLIDLNLKLDNCRYTIINRIFYLAKLPFRKDLNIILDPKNFKIKICLSFINIEEDNIYNFSIRIEKDKNGNEHRIHVPRIIYGADIIINMRLVLEINNPSKVLY